jgi:hypothetical protein
MSLMVPGDSASTDSTAAPSDARPLSPWDRANTSASTTLGEKFSLNPVMHLGKPGDVDAEQAEYPSILFGDNVVWMFYSGYGAVRHRWEIAGATSVDGIHWTKLGGIFPPGDGQAWDASSVAFPCVLHSNAAPNGERFRMWYAGKRAALYEGIGYATSADGKQWIRQGQVLALGRSGEWDAGQLADPAVIPVQDGYRMYYCGSESSRELFDVGLAFSADGRSWTKHSGNPIVSVVGTDRQEFHTFDMMRDADAGLARRGPTHDGIYTVDVVILDGEYFLFVGVPNAARELEIQVLHSPDGIAFSPGERRLVLAPSHDGTWDSAMVYGMEVLAVGDQIYLWFNGIYERDVPKGGEIGIARIPIAELQRLFQKQ